MSNTPSDDEHAREEQEEQAVAKVQQWISDAVKMTIHDIAAGRGAGPLCDSIDALSEFRAKTILKVALAGLATTGHELLEEMQAAELRGVDGFHDAA